MSDHSRDEVINRGIRCKKLLEDPDLDWAFKEVDSAIIKTMRECSQEDTDALIYMKQALHVLSSVRANLDKACKDGKLEEFRIEQEESGVTFLGDKLWKKKR